MAGGGGALSAERQKRGRASKRKKMKRVGFHLDMTPLVDITFLLLTFFMFTTTMATPQIMEMSIPPESKPIDVKEDLLLTLRVRADGVIFWNIANDDPEKIELKKIKELAEKENLRKKKRNQLITVLKVDDNAPYGRVINILDELNLAEIKISEEIAKEIDDKGKPTKRKRKFTLAPMTEKDLEQISEEEEEVAEE